MSGYDQVKELSRDTGIPIPGLLALARNNDPYFAGAPAQQSKAEWFAKVWQRFGYGTGVHLRRVHYQLMSTGALLPDGKPYENTLGCWGFLCDAGKAARYLGLVNPLAFEDRRNPAPQGFVWEPYGSKTPSAYVTQDEHEFPVIESDLSYSIHDPYTSVDGYSYEAADQPYYLALYVEKSTMNDVLIPVCRRLGMDLFVSLGFQSITTVVNMLQRIQRFGKPARIFYVSDFDPAGDFMPVGVARQIEYWRERYCDQEVKLQPIVLTASQVAAYQLPPAPIKESDLRADGFTGRYGVSGATELDALEALHPGALARVVRDAALPYRDMGFEQDLSDARIEAESEAADHWGTVASEELDELEAIRQAVQTIAATYTERLAAMNAELQEQLAPLVEQAADLRNRFDDRIEYEFRPSLPARPEPDAEGDNQEMLLDTNRDYMTQLAVYKARRAGKEIN